MKLHSAANKLLGRLTRRDEFTDQRIRRKFEVRYGIVVGEYTYGCFDRSRIDPNTRFGRYCSIARTAVVLNRNHGVDYLSTTPFLFNSRLGLLKNDTFEYVPCDISDDVWLGHNSVLAPSTTTVGRGAVIAAGAVVTRNVPAYAIMAGVPAKVVRYRFPQAIIEKIEATRWWEWDLQELKERALREPDMVFRPGQFFSASTSRC